MENRLRSILDSGKAAIGAQLRFGSPAIAEMAGLAGFDWVLIDTEHAPQTPFSVQGQLQGAECSGATPLVRTAKNDPDMIRLYLDMGAGGVVVPFVNTAEEAARAADACRYPPRGTRGWGPHRAAGYGLFEHEYTATIDDEVLFFPIIESRESIENIDGIMAIDGVDGCIVGPVDLCISLGIPFQFEHSKYMDALERVRSAAQSEGKPAGHPLRGPVSDTEAIQEQVAQGVRLLLISGDEPALKSSFVKTVQDLSCLREST